MKNTHLAKEKEEKWALEQEISFRGDYDSGTFSWTRPQRKNGNFRALLRVRTESSGRVLETHVINSTKNLLIWFRKYITKLFKFVLISSLVKLLIKSINRRWNHGYFGRWTAFTISTLCRFFEECSCSKRIFHWISRS